MSCQLTQPAQLSNHDRLSLSPRDRAPETTSPLLHSSPPADPLIQTGGRRLHDHGERHRHSAFDRANHVSSNPADPHAGDSRTLLSPGAPSAPRVPWPAAATNRPGPRWRNGRGAFKMSGTTRSFHGRAGGERADTRGETCPREGSWSLEPLSQERREPGED